MKILAFTDTHGVKRHFAKLKVASSRADLVICCGDFTLFGKDQKKFLEYMDSWGKTIIMIHGNHEEDSSLRKACSSTNNVLYAHNEAVVINGVTIVAHGGGGFSADYPDFEENMNQFIEISRKSKKCILLTHAPPFETKLDEIYPGNHVGALTYRYFIEKAKPALALSGHIHEKFGQRDTLGSTVLVNPGPDGKFIDF